LPFLHLGPCASVPDASNMDAEAGSDASSDAKSDVVATDGGSSGDAAPGQPCQSNATCAPGSFCLTPDGSCASTGTCTLLPATCPTTNDPVCGCDGNPYQNPCLCNKAGQSVGSHAAC
jgi:hypothetical protein